MTAAPDRSGRPADLLRDASEIAISAFLVDSLDFYAWLCGLCFDGRGNLSPDHDARARKNYSLIVQRIASVGNAPVALAVGCNESTISRMKPEKFLEFARILAVLDLKVVPVGMKCFNEKTVEVLMYGHRQWTQMIETPEQLEWD